MISLPSKSSVKGKTPSITEENGYSHKIGPWPYRSPDRTGCHFDCFNLFAWLWGTRHSYCEEQYLEAFKAAESFYVEDGELQITSGKLLLIYAEENSGMLQGLVTIGPINLIS